MMESVSLSHLGLVRERNEDSIVEDASLGLWVVADGVGGNGFGNIASQIATQTLERRVRQGASLVRATQDANAAIVSAASERLEYRNMATTVVACSIDRNHYEISWVGDSRAYLIDDTGIAQLTSDHNMANALVAQGVITHEAAQRHPGQHELTQALGHMYEDKPSVCVGELHEGEIMLMCTDGLSGVISDQEILDIVKRADSLAQASENLLAAVLAGGAPDNVSFILLRYHQDVEQTHAGDFEARSFRQPFDASHYLEHARSRPWLIVVIIVALLFLGLVI